MFGSAVGRGNGVGLGTGEGVGDGWEVGGTVKTATGSSVAVGAAGDGADVEPAPGAEAAGWAVHPNKKMKISSVIRRMVRKAPDCSGASSMSKQVGFGSHDEVIPV